MWLLSLCPCLGDEPSLRDLFGASLASVGDLDGGGLPDLAVGDPVWTDQPHESGRVWLVSMETGCCIRRIDPPAPRQAFGWTMAAVGDVDGDGASDLCVGTLQWDWGGLKTPSSAHVVSSTTGRTIHAFEADAEGLSIVWDTFGPGPAVCGVGDWDGDGRTDIAVGSPKHAERGACRGRVDIYSGKSGGRLYRFVGDAEYSGFGTSVCAMGDVDGDGQSELAVGAVVNRNNACHERINKLRDTIRVHSSLDGAVIATLTGWERGVSFGFTLAGATDLDRDERPDLWIGESYTHFSVMQKRTPGVELWSSRGWRQLGRAVPRNIGSGYAFRFASAIVEVDDLDGDGLRDVVATHPDSFANTVAVLSADGREIGVYDINPTRQETAFAGQGWLDIWAIGNVAVRAGDLDGDLSCDVFLGGVTWRGCVDAIVSAWSPKKGKHIRLFTRDSIQSAEATEQPK
jgi:hypothetical protein